MDAADAVAGAQPRAGSLIVYEIAGSGFLRHMVRNIVGTLVEIGRGRRPPDWMREVLDGRDRRLAGPTAPPHGLVLLSVEYEAGLLAAER
jgi:tRNA pseudouridine38-40 synthase